MADKPSHDRGGLMEVAGLFFKLGLIAFGGPAAHIAMMEDEVVRRRKWIEEQHFLDLVGATNLIPGPNSTEMTMHCGKERAGLAGLIVAGAAFIFPAVVLTGLLAHLYVTYGQVPQVEPFLYGIKPAVLAIILSAIYKLGRKALKNAWLGLLGLAVVLAGLMGLNPVLAILAAGGIGLLFSGGDLLRKRGFLLALPILFWQKAQMAATGITTAKIFWVFLKVGSVLFGSGYVLVAYLEGELIARRSWLTEPELLDAIAIGQFTPGPVLSTATFIGYQLNGIQGAVAATLGIFLPSFLFVYLLNPLIPKLRSSRLAAAFLDSVNVAAVGIMIAVTIELGRSVLIDWQAWLIALIAAGAVLGPRKVSSFWIVLGGAVLGYLAQTIW
ncbi:MAG: chromate efflux transporter [Saprospiraceae bacterium]|nr:chromate efflux transporter [Saprospiraceae bacterium]